MNKIACVLALFTFLLVGTSYESHAQKGKRRTRKTVKTAPKKVTVEKEEVKVDAAPLEPIGPKYAYRYINVDSLDYDSTGYNSLSVNPIHVSDVMFRMKINRRIPLKEKCNRPFYNTNNEITTHLIQGLVSGKLIAYDPDSNSKILPINYIEDYLTKVDPFDGSKSRMKGSELDYIDLVEDLIFDSQRSMTYYDIHYIIVTSPADPTSGRNLATRLAAIRYKDLEAYWATLPTSVRWRNPANNKENRTFAEAFRLRLFCGVITKIDKDNATGVDLQSLPENQGNMMLTLLNAQQVEMDLVSWENELYEY